MKKYSIVSLIIPVILSGCVTYDDSRLSANMTTIAALEESLQPVPSNRIMIKDIPNENEDISIVKVKRFDNKINNNCYIEFYIDDVPVAKLGTNEFLSIKVKPGVHKFKVSHDLDGVEKCAMPKEQLISTVREEEINLKPGFEYNTVVQKFRKLSLMKESVLYGGFGIFGMMYERNSIDKTPEGLHFILQVDRKGVPIGTLNDRVKIMEFTEGEFTEHAFDYLDKTPNTAAVVFVNMAYPGCPLAYFIDGKKVGVSTNTSLFYVPEGKHNFQATYDWTYNINGCVNPNMVQTQELMSPEMPFEVQAGNVYTLNIKANSLMLSKSLQITPQIDK